MTAPLTPPDCDRPARTWTDFRGVEWKVSESRHALKFNIPCHAALRAHVFHRDGYRCMRCPAAALDVPARYDGRAALRTNTFDSKGWRDILVVDHILTRRAGGTNEVANLQTLCECCNKSKQREDIAAAASYRETRT